MKVALVIERMDTARGGRETSTAQIAAGLARRGCEVTLICQSGSWRHDDVEMVLLGGSGATKTARLRKFVSDVQSEIDTCKFDIVHTTLPIPGANVYQPRGGTLPGQRDASLRRRSIVGRWLRGATWPLNSFRREMANLERLVMADDATMCLAVSQMVADEITRYYSRDAGVRVVYNAVDAPAGDAEQRGLWRRERRARLGLGERGMLFLTIATNFELKGVAETIEAFARWRRSCGEAADARLVVVGRNVPEKYQQYASVRKVGGLVHFVGRSRAEEVARWYAAADACVLLSWYDPCSRVVLEAARVGVPSITTAFNGASEAIADGGGLVVASPRDIRGVVAAMETLADPVRREAMSAACLERSESLGIERHVDELMTTYGEVVRRK